MLTAVQNLKLYILANGIKIDHKAEEMWLSLYGGPMTLGEYASTSGICIYTDNLIYMNAPFTEAFTRNSQAWLYYDNGFVVVKEDLRVPVTVIPVPAYHQQIYHGEGIAHPYTEFGVTHTDRCRVSPIGGCAWKCAFCDIPYEQRYHKKPKEELLNVINMAVGDPLAPARHVLVSGGTPRCRDEQWIDECYAYLAQHSPIPVDVMMPVREDMHYPEWLKSVGVNMVSINLEISDLDRALVITPSKARIHGRQRYLDYIEKCVEVFGVGGVQSLMVFGSSIEPLGSTLAGVQDLVDRGCIPVLSQFRPDPATPMGDLPPASEEEMRLVYEATMDICLNSGTAIRPGPRCIACHHNTIAFPDGSSFYVDEHGDLAVPL